MAVNLSALSNLALTAQALSNLILVNPQKDIGITEQKDDATAADGEPETFLFNFNGEESVTLESDITDHYAEDNKALQDQIALKPVIINTSGYIGELNDVTPKLLEPLKLAADKLTVLTPFVPVISATALIAYNNAAQAYAIAERVKNASVAAWGTITGGSGTPVQTKQQIAFAKFFGWYQNRQLFTVQTPWAVFRNMAIKNFRTIQPEETNSYSNFEITFKQMRFSQSLTITSGIAFQGRSFDQAADVVDHGVSTPIPDVGLSAQLSSVA